LLSDVQAVESGFNHFIHDPSAGISAIYAVDEEIEQLKAVEAAKQLLHSQLARRNALAPISVLPPEVLARVFYFLLVFENPTYFGERNLGWIRATHVCRYWREVALDDSSLWATIWGASTNTELISEMLTRAKNAP
jgi:F-box-like